MSSWKSAWWWGGKDTPAFDKREVVGFVPAALSGEEEHNGVVKTLVLLRGGHCVVLLGTVEAVVSQVYGQWPPDGDEADQPQPVGTKQPIETMNVTGPALAADICAAWEQAWSMSPNETYSQGAHKALSLLCTRLGIDPKFAWTPGDDTTAAKK